jgi:hypothetical protein
MFSTPTRWVNSNKQPEASNRKHPERKATLAQRDAHRRVHGVEDRFAGYTVYDNAGSKIGKVDDLFLDENDSPST